MWRAVRNWSRKTLEKAGERVVDVQGDLDDDMEDEIAYPTEAEPESGKIR